MKVAIAILFFVGLFGLWNGQEKPPGNHAVTPSVGLEVGQPAPALAVSDQFGHEQSNETLKGSKCTILLVRKTLSAKSDNPVPIGISNFSRIVALNASDCPRRFMARRISDTSATGKRSPVFWLH
jgi:hypothetical protein